MKWEDHFDYLILDRGYDYYQEGRVREVVQDGEGVRALVRGSDMYQVSLDFEEGDLFDMTCDCPYAAKGYACKHMAAVLYQVESGEAELQESATPRSSHDPSPMLLDAERIGHLVDGTDEVLLREFLKKLLLEDESWRLCFWTILHPLSKTPSIDVYQTRIQKQIDRYRRFYDWQDWRGADELIDEVQEVFFQGMDAMKKGRLFMNLFDLSSFILYSLADFDQMSESLGEVLASCEHAWWLIDEEGDDEDRLYLLGGLRKLLQDCRFPDLAETIDWFVYPLFDREPFLLLKVDLIEERIRRLEKSETFEPSYNGWIMGDLYKKRIELMEKESASWQAITNFAFSQWHYAKVRLYYVEACERQGDLGRAISLLEESLELDDRGHRSHAADSHRVLARLYKANGQREQYLTTLWALATKIEPANFEHYQALRDAYRPEVWPEHRCLLLEQLRDTHARERILAEEGLWDELLALAVTQEGLAMLGRHKAELLAFKPERVLEKYEREIQGMAEHASSRSRYRELVALLRQMRQMPGGATEVERIITGWRRDYKRRYAMQEELDRLPGAPSRHTAAKSFQAE